MPIRDAKFFQLKTAKISRKQLKRRSNYSFKKALWETKAGLLTFCLFL